MQKDISHLTIGPQSYEKTIETQSGPLTIKASRFSEFQHWILPPVAWSGFSYDRSLKWWERRSGDHGGGHFNIDQYHRYLAAIYK